MDILKVKNTELKENPPKQSKTDSTKEYGEATFKKADNLNCYLGLIWSEEWLIKKKFSIFFLNF